jgi:alanyl-tRNA synthetase
MTERLYHRDSSLRTFTARVVRSEPGGTGRFLAVLDRTAFYPTSGGQPFDTGSLAGCRVLEVTEDESGDVVHVTDGPVEPGTAVEGAIDWARRFDHMQQHTGQHVLSAAFERVCGVATLSVHLGSTAATIDLDREVTRAEIDRAERAANDVVWEDRPVAVRFVDAAEAAALPLRKASARAGLLRLVEVADFDLSACGGTHVSCTGAVGFIAVAGWERFKSGTRVTFRCGSRALEAYRGLRDSAAEAGRLLSAAAADVPDAIHRMATDHRALERRLTALTADLASVRAEAWRAQAETVGRFRGVLRVETGADGAAIKSVAQALVSGDTGLVAVIAAGGQPAPIVGARSAGVGLDAGAFVKALASALGGRGGGRAELAQGGVNADATRALATARQLLAEM